MLNGRLYVMGGFQCNKLQVLDMSEENEVSWTVKADLPAERFNAASVAHEGKLWLIGGCNSSETMNNSVLIYDIDADSWGTGPALPEYACDLCATKLNDEVYITGVRADLGATWIYRNAMWERLPGGPGVDSSTFASVILG